MMKVLVGYASARGSTREIAERIGARLRVRGIDADVVSLEHAPDARRYSAYVLGSAVHNMSWLPAATSFVRRHLEDLSSAPVWLFSVGSKDSLRGPVGRRMAARYPIPKGIAEYHSAIRPHEHRILTGVIRRDQYPAISRAAVWLFGGRYGDFRDWPAIDAWTDLIADRLTSRRDTGPDGAPRPASS